MAVSRSQVLNGMVAALAALTPAVGGPITTSAYVRSVGRYTGKASVEELLQDGVAGRTPAVQVAYEGETPFRRVMGPSERVTASYVAYCITDSRDTRDGRARVLQLTQDVRQKLGKHSFGLAIRRFHFESESLFADTEKVIVYAVRFSTVYRVDYSIDPGNDLMESATGDIHVPNTDDVDGKVYGEIDIPLNQESA